MLKNYQHFINKEFNVKLYVIIFASLMIAILLVFIILNKTSLNQYKNQEKILSEKITDLENKYSISRTKIDHLRKKTSNIEKVLQSIPHLPDLKINGTDDPIGHIKKDLIKRNDLIPFEGVLGGTMGFYDENRIHILNYRWVYAHFEDGHIGGEMLLEYDISEDGKIKWNIIDFYK